MRGVVLILTICTSVFGCHCFAQNSDIETTNNGKIEGETVSLFNKEVGAQSEIYNGVVYTLYPSATKGTFYFQDKNTVTPASIIYNGTLYKDVPVIYDVYHNQMVSFANSHLFVLVPENLSDVYLDDHHFINTTVDDVPGYYEELYSGKSQVLLKRTKLIEEHIVPPQTAETWYISKSPIFVRSNNRYVAISGKGALLKAFAGKRKEIELFLNDNKLDFASAPESVVAKAATYYDTLKP